jgi:hypothetical protein
MAEADCVLSTPRTLASKNEPASPKSDRAAIMRRAWAIFRDTYRYPSIPFRSIGRPCFAWALRKALTADDKAALISTLQRSIELESFNEHWPSARCRIAVARAEIAQLSAR